MIKYIITIVNKLPMNSSSVLYVDFTLRQYHTCQFTKFLQNSFVNLKLMVI